jgi:hypothetical protein
MFTGQFDSPSLSYIHNIAGFSVDASTIFGLGCDRLSHVGVQLGLKRTNIFAFTNMSGCFSAHNLQHLSVEGVWTVLPDCIAKLPITLFSQCALDMLKPAAAKGLDGRAVLDIGHADILKLAYG